MAIEVVQLSERKRRQALEHTYRHDLESFFYVFLEMCLNHGWGIGKGPKEDPLRPWYIGDYDSLVRAKAGDMGLYSFKKLVLPRFSPAFERVKGLALKLREALFLSGSELRTGTPTESPHVLYDQMINAFDEAIKAR